MKLRIMLEQPALQGIELMPQKATPGSAGYDLVANIDHDVCIAPGETTLIPTGIRVEVGDDYAVFLYARSGLASKFGITMANCVGVVDSDYRGEVKCPLINLSQKEFIVTPGMRIAQMVVTRIERPEIEICDMLNDTSRSAGGFGSSGLSG